jgi:hypothetical protein
MNPTWTDVVAALTGVGSLLITTIGLIFVYVQIRKLRQGLWSDTQSRLCDQSLELIRFLAEKPETYDYFYQGKPLAEDEPNRVFIFYAAEALANFMEHLVLQKRNLPEQQWQVWHRFICSTYEGSSALQEFFLHHRTWYSPELLAIIDERDRRPPYIRHNVA